MRVTAEIDLKALQHNLSRVRSTAPRAQVLAMVKANAYGHGLVLCSSNLDVEYLGIASLVEAHALRDAGVVKRIVFMPGIQNEQDLKALKEMSLDTVIYDERQIALLRQYPSQDKTRVWLKINTGMHRLGCGYEHAARLLKELEQLRHVEIVAVMTHLACADEVDNPYNQKQFERFEALTRHWSYARSVLNSAGILNFPEFQYDIVRPGLMLYGASPIANKTVHVLDLEPVMEMRASILAIDEVPVGEGVGYGITWTAKHSTKVAIVSSGYGDGYPQVPHHAKVLINGNLCDVVGRVSMDFLAVDISHAGAVKEGDPALLWGKALLANDAADYLDVSVYRLLTGVMERVPRQILSY